MKRVLILFFLVTLLSAFSIYAGFPDISFDNDFQIPNKWFPKDRADFTWNWVGPEGGIIRRVIVDPSNNNLGFAISDGGDLWRTVDGNSWLLVPDFLYRGPSCALYSAPDTAIVCVWSTLYNTVNGGDTWTENSQTFNSVQGLSETTSNIVYLGDMDYGNELLTIYRSSDKGINWTLIDSITNVSDFHLIRFDPSNDSIIYLGIDFSGTPSDTATILKSINMGSTWTQILQSSSSFSFDEVADIEVNPQNGDEIFTCFGFGTPLTGPYYSSNGGTNWQQLPNAIAALLLIPFDVEFSDSNNIIVSNLFPPGIFRGMRIAGDWQFTKVDSTVGYLDVENGNSGTMYASTMANGIYKSTTGGNSWFPVKTNLRAFIASYNFQNISQFNNSTLYAVPQFSTPVFKTTNGGLSWEEYFFPQWIFKQAIELYKGNPDIVYLSGFGIEADMVDTLFFSFYRSTDGGANWTPMDTISNPDTSSSFLSLWVSPTDSSKLLGVLPSDTINYLYYSTDEGRNWIQTFSNVFTDIRGTDTVFIGADTTLYMSHDKGENWQPLIYNIWVKEMSYNPDNQLLYVVRPTVLGDSLGSIDLSGNLINIADVTGGFHSMSTPGGNDIYISFVTGAYLPLFLRSSDGGQTFDIDTLSFLPSLLRASPNEILLADFGKSFRRSTDAVSVDRKEKKPALRNDISITPSIFHNQTNIKLSILQSESMEINVWGVDGRHIKTIYKGKVIRGRHRYIWNGIDSKGKEVSSGIYFIKIKIDEKSAYIRKVTKLR